ncbi:MAG: hypothetical protein ABW104_09445 [Candidatus Thiodiazotropha sp. 6PLUC2]
MLGVLNKVVWVNIPLKHRPYFTIFFCSWGSSWLVRIAGTLFGFAFAGAVFRGVLIFSPSKSESMHDGIDNETNNIILSTPHFESQVRALTFGIPSSQ